MIKEIKYPANKKHWICYNADGSVMHFGETEPNQVTSTGLPTLEGFDSEVELANFIATTDVSLYDPIPVEGEWCELNKVYAYGDDKVKCIQAHTRTHFTPEETPNLFSIIPTIANLCDAEPWDAANWLAYQTVGYLVKYNNKVWASKLPISHTWIAPALEGNGAISWEFIQDCV